MVVGGGLPVTRDYCPRDEVHSEQVASPLQGDIKTKHKYIHSHLYLKNSLEVKETRVPRVNPHLFKKNPVSQQKSCGEELNLQAFCCEVTIVSPIFCIC